MANILITTSSFDIANNPSLQGLLTQGFKIVSNPYQRRLQEQELYELLSNHPDTVGIIAGVEPITRKTLDVAKQLHVISRCGTGMDNVDLIATKELGIHVCNTPDAPGAAVAELTLALMLNLLRHVNQADKKIRNDKWQPIMGSLLSSAVVGIIGYGRIGQQVAKLVQAFGAKVIAYDLMPKSLDADIDFVDLNTLYQTADIVSLHLPYTKNNYQLINESALKLMKSSAILINTARGELVDETALYNALLAGQIRAAGLDVFVNEPYNGNFIELPQVVMTAHMGSYTQETRRLMESEATNNLINQLRLSGLLV